MHDGADSSRRRQAREGRGEPGVMFRSCSLHAVDDYLYVYGNEFDRRRAMEERARFINFRGNPRHYLTSWGLDLRVYMGYPKPVNPYHWNNDYSLGTKWGKALTVKTTSGGHSSNARNGDRLHHQRTGGSYTHNNPTDDPMWCRCRLYIHVHKWFSSLVAKRSTTKS